jgi:hypothetical protein
MDRIMNTLTTTVGTTSPSVPPVAIAVRAPRSVLTDLALYALLASLVVGAWQFSKFGYFESGDDLGYWLGVAGGTMMLLLFLYPVRKYARFAHRWGKVKWWFYVHMVLGISGPLLILVHSTFHLRSTNATVALFSMVIVALSGVVGRFLYLRIHRGLQGERSNLADLQKKAGLAEGEMRSRFRFAPEVAQRLLEFEALALAGQPGWATMLKRVVLLPLQQSSTSIACARDLRRRLRAIGNERGWRREQLRRREHQATSLMRIYLLSIVRVAQFAAYERLFALWHVLHVPFVYLLVLTAGFHIFAVHAY